MTSYEMKRAPQNGAHALSDAVLWLAYQGLQHLAEIRGRVLLGWSLIAQSSHVALVESDGGVEMHLALLRKNEGNRRHRNKTP